MFDREAKDRPLETPQEGQSTSIQSHYEMLATRHIIGVYREVVRLRLEEARYLDERLIEAVLEEWYYIALCPDRAPKAEDALSHADFLEEIRPGYALRRKLPEDATWNDIIVDAMSDFDEPIGVGIENGWAWERVLQLYRDSDHIDTALRFGVDPDVRPGLLVDIIKQQTWELRLSTAMIEQETAMLEAEAARKEEELANRLVEAAESLGLPEGSTLAELENAIKRRYLAQLLNRSPEDITDEDIADFFDS